MGIQSLVLKGSSLVSGRFSWIVIIVLILGFSGCSSTSENHSGHLPVSNAPLSVLILPFSNLTTTPDAGKSVTTILISSLIRQNSLRVVSSESIPFEVPGGISAMNIPPGLRDRLRSMGVDMILSGSVIEYGYRSELESEPVVGLTWMMTDLASGKILWSVRASGVGSCFWGCSQTLTSLSGKLIRREVERFVRQ
jgi:TolB-like protein